MNRREWFQGLIAFITGFVAGRTSAPARRDAAVYGPSVLLEPSRLYRIVPYILADPPVVEPVELDEIRAGDWFCWSHALNVLHRAARNAAPWHRPNGALDWYVIVAETRRLGGAAAQRAPQPPSRGLLSEANGPKGRAAGEARE